MTVGEFGREEARAGEILKHPKEALLITTFQKLSEKGGGGRGALKKSMRGKELMELLLHRRW